MATGQVSPKRGKVIDIPAEAPTIGTATDLATTGKVSVTVTAGSTSTGGPVFKHTAISNPSSITGTSTTSPITVSGLTDGTAYTFTVVGTNATGNGPSSAASNSATPSVPPTAYDSIATVTVGSGGSAEINFTSISATYTHLQIRGLFLTTTAGRSPRIEFNSDTGSNFSNHLVYSTGANAYSGANVSNAGMYIGGSNTGTSTTWPFVFVTDILDYTNTNKYTTIRTLSGLDSNGDGEMSLFSGAWRNTAAVSSIRIYATSGTFAQYSSIALYGIKGA